MAVTSPLIRGLSEDLAHQAQSVARIIRNGQNLQVYSLYQAKNQLVKALGLADGFHRYKMIFGPGPGLQRVRQDVISQLAKARSDAVDFHLFHGGGEAVEICPPPVTGESDIRTIRGKSRAVFAACFENATAFSRSSTIRLADGSFVFDIQEGELDLEPVDLSLDPVVFHHNGIHVDCIADTRFASRLNVGTALSLLGTESNAFGHWMIEEFLKYLTMRTLSKLKNIPILIDSGMPPQHRQSIAALCGEAQPIIEVPPFMQIQAERLWIVSRWIYAPRLIRPEAFLGQVPLNVDALAFPVRRVASLYREAAEQLEEGLGCQDHTDLIYVTRNPERYRALSNHEEIAALLARKGYREVRPEQLSFLDQFALYRSSRSIIIQAGSATFGLFFCAPSTSVLQLSHGLIPAHAAWAAICRENGVDARILTGPSTKQHEVYYDKSDYWINPQVLDACCLPRD